MIPDSVETIGRSSFPHVRDASVPRSSKGIDDAFGDGAVIEYRDVPEDAVPAKDTVDGTTTADGDEDTPDDSGVQHDSEQPKETKDETKEKKKRGFLSRIFRKGKR